MAQPTGPPSWPPPSTPAPPPLPPPSPPTRRHRRGLAVGALVAAGALAAGGLWLATRDGDGRPTSAATSPRATADGTGAPGTTEPVEPTAPSTAVTETTETTAVDETTSTTVAVDEHAAEYLGVVLENLDQDDVPAGVAFIAAALVAPGYHYAVAHVEDSAGQLFWLARPRDTAPDGSLTEWEVLDAVRLPEDAGGDDVTVLGDTLCRLAASGSELPVAAVFRLSLEDFVSNSRGAWIVDLTAERLDWIDGTVSCPNPAAGI